MDLVSVFVLLIIFQIKHFCADYPLQTDYMLQKFRADWGFVRPLLAHAAVHAALTLSICVLWGRAELGIPLGILDGTLHFCMDRVKASPRMLGRFKALSPMEFRAIEAQRSMGKPESAFRSLLDGNRHFWWSLGFDQMFHHLTHYLIAYVLLSW